MDNLDFERIKAQANLVDEIEHDLGPGKKSGRYVMFRCPFPGHGNDDRHPSLAVTSDNGRWYCFGCGRSGDFITWLRDYRKLDWKDIFSLGSINPYSSPNPLPRSINEIKPIYPPSYVWQKRASGFLEYCEQQLWKSQRDKLFLDPHTGILLSPLEYLQQKRGLDEVTIKRYRLGYNPISSYQPEKVWGLKEDSVKADLWLPQGITIPCFAEGEVWGINIRRPDINRKYHKVRGSKAGLFGANNLREKDIVMLTEGEFDCILADLLIGDLVSVATLGGNTTNLDIATWGKYLMPMREILVAYDVDGKSKNGIATLLSKTAQAHSVRIPVLRPGDKDITDYVMAGGDLRSWLLYQLNKLAIPLEIPVDPVIHQSAYSITQVQTIDLNYWQEIPWQIDITRPCISCGDKNYQAYEHGNGYFCATCHPTRKDNQRGEPCTSRMNRNLPTMS
jgi:hypothetical protein